MRSCVLLPVLAFVSTMESCSTHSALIGNKQFNPDRVHEIVLANQSRMLTAAGEGTISVETPTIAQSGSFSLTLKKPDSLLITLQGPFGIRVGAAMVTRTNFVFYSSLENRVYSGASSARNLSRIVRLNVGFDDLVNLFTGGVFLKGDAGNPDTTGVEDGEYTLLYRNEGSVHKYYIDPESYLITRTEALDDVGKLELDQRFLNFQTVDSTRIPFNIRIIQPKERRMVSVVYSNLSLNPPNLKLDFSYPQSAKRVAWQ